VDDYLRCLKAHGVDLRQPDKSRARAWLASTADPDWHIGTAAEKGIWHFDAQAFQPLWVFLSEMYA
jgi:hypothetical protein